MQQLRRLCATTVSLSLAGMFYLEYKHTGNATVLLLGACLPLGVAMAFLGLLLYDKFKQRNT